MLKFPSPKEYYELLENPAKKEEYKKLLKALSNKVTSRDYFQLSSSNRLYQKRDELHTDILKSILDEYQSSDQPRIHFLLGSIGSGKTSAKDQILKYEKNKTDFIFINFDDLKKRLPEYELLKKLNPKKAAQFVQSESSKLAGKLFKKAVQKKCNIMFEKNVRRIQMVREEIMKTVKKGYLVFIHIVFLDSYEEAWKRVQKRAEEIRRFVPKEEVKETFNNLFPNFNTLCQNLSKESLVIYFWYNGAGVKKALWLSSVLTGDRFSKYEFKDVAQIKHFKQEGLYAGWVEEVRFDSLPRKVVKTLKNLDFFKNIP